MMGSTTALLALVVAGGAMAESSPYSGLWVGSATLGAVNEVSVSLDKDNVSVARDPRVPTATFDAAEVRLILHVNGAGQAFLLKDAAILNRVAPAGGAGEGGQIGNATEGDLAIVTDPRLYAEFPPQPAMRIATVSYDFGDARTSEALDRLAAGAADAARTFTLGYGGGLATPDERNTARNAFLPGQVAALGQAVAADDVSEAFGQFLLAFDSGVLDTIANNPSDPVVAGFQAQAEALRDASGFGDTRGLEIVAAAVQAAHEARAVPGFEIEDVKVAVRNAASAVADGGNLYQRFVSGKILSDMLSAAAQAAPAAAKAGGATQATVEAALRGVPASTAAITEALTTKVQAYDDQRAEQAVTQVIAAVAAAAFDNRTEPDAVLRRLAEAAGRQAMAELPRYATPSTSPSLDYDQFVKSAGYAGIPTPLATAAINAAMEAKADDPLFTAESVYNAALLAGVNAMRGHYLTAARAQRTELPLEGAFAPGSGDTRLVGSLANPGDLGPAGLVGRIVLPEDYPTNPFRHRRHPDHTTGYNIERVVRLDFDAASGGSLEAAGYGVDAISGTYREEIFGLHKPLGPEPESNPIGLKTEGRFELRRISRIDTLNAR
jgi:hypothetical protein